MVVLLTRLHSAKLSPIETTVEYKPRASKLVPVSVTAVPPVSGPEFGVIPVTASVVNTKPFASVAVRPPG